MCPRYVVESPTDQAQRPGTGAGTPATGSATQSPAWVAGTGLRNRASGLPGAATPGEVLDEGPYERAPLVALPLLRLLTAKTPGSFRSISSMPSSTSTVRRRGSS